jgi:hypothetical protein
MNDMFCFSIDLPVRNEWRNIDLLRTSVQNCFTAVFADVDSCHTVAMVTGELLENALKYGAWRDDSRPIFRLRVDGSSRQVTVSVQNPIREGDGNVDQLVECLAWIASFPQPEKAYRARMMQIASSPDAEHPSRLGLVRIAYEANCRLSAEVDPLSHSLVVTAHIESPAKQPPA